MGMNRPSDPGSDPLVLDPRARLLLRTLISRYIRDGEPVGSQTLARHAGLDVSPATIRNILAELEDVGLLAAPQNLHAGIAKYPLLALPMFVLVGSIFDRSGVAQRMVLFAQACVGRSPGMLPMVAILVAMVLGGISGSGPANAAAVGGVMIAAMARAGYPNPFSASIVGAAAATDILIPPSIAFVVYSVNMPGASVPALFAGCLAGAALARLDDAAWRTHLLAAAVGLQLVFVGVPMLAVIHGTSRTPGPFGEGQFEPGLYRTQTPPPKRIAPWL